MKARIFNLPVTLFAALLLIANVGFAATLKNVKGLSNEQVKNYSKTYTVDGNDRLLVNNRYGKVTVNTWNRNEFKVDVEIKIGTNNADDTRKMLDNISVSDKKEGNDISFQTNIASEKLWGAWTGQRNEAHKLEINYTIYMPVKNDLSITDNFGAIVLPDLDGKVLINSGYGSLTAKTLSNNANEIKVGYGGAHIDNVATCKIDVKYGGLDLGSADNLTAEVGYGAAKIGKINKSANINMKGGELNIADISKNLQALNINSSYGSVKIGLSGDENADINVTVKYGNFNYGSHSVTLSNKTAAESRKGWNPTQNYTGHLGKGDPNKVINISVAYGSIRFE